MSFYLIRQPFREIWNCFEELHKKLLLGHNSGVLDPKVNSIPFYKVFNFLPVTGERDVPCGVQENVTCFPAITQEAPMRAISEFDAVFFLEMIFEPFKS